MRTGSEAFPPIENTIFLVEADEVVRSAIQFILREENQTYAFASLDQAMTEAEDLRPNGVLLGISVVRDRGDRVIADFLRRLPAVKILLVVDSVSDPLVAASLQRGAHDVLGKPITFDAVRDRVNALLGRHPRRTHPLDQPAAL